MLGQSLTVKETSSLTRAVYYKFCVSFYFISISLNASIMHLLLNNGGVARPCARARQANRVLTQGRRGVQGRTGASRDKSLKMT